MPLSSNTYPTLKLFALSVITTFSFFYTSSALAIETTNSFSAPSLTLVRDSDGVQVPIDLSDADGTERMLCYDASEQKVILGSMIGYQPVDNIRHTTAKGEFINQGGDYGCNLTQPQNFMDCPLIPPSSGYTTESLDLLNQVMDAGYTHPQYYEDHSATSAYIMYVCKESEGVLRRFWTDNLWSNPPPPTRAYFDATTNYATGQGGASTFYYTLLCFRLTEAPEAPATTCEP